MPPASDRHAATSAASSAPEGRAGAPDALQLEGLRDRFHVLAELARGGMGRVLLAEDAVLQREVAIKQPLNPGPRALRRFEREALLTARLEHPGIVSIHELLQTHDGSPLLVMRRVNGEPFSAVMHRAHTAHARLALLPPFIALAETVAYAHDHGVIHRDLKPDNVLIGPFGETVVIDWGLAKDLNGRDVQSDEGEPESASPPLVTRQGAVMGTPAYMSPEQARGELVDRRTDVYALGAVLYELLSGSRPYGAAGGKEAVEAIRRGPPPPLANVARDLPPELFTIVARAMDRDAPNRYADAKELTADLKAFQTGRLVRSHRYSTRELVLRWARRNATALVLTAVFLAVLAGTAIVSVRDVLAERDRANAEARAAEQVASFLTGMFEGADPSQAKGRVIAAREILDRGAKRIDALSGQPLVQARLLHTIGTVYDRLGAPEGEPLLRRALAARERLLGPDHPDTLQTRSELGQALEWLGKPDEAEKVLRETAAAQARVLGPDDKATLWTLRALGTLLTNRTRYDDARAVEQKVIDGYTRTLGPMDPTTLSARGDLAETLGADRQFAEATRLFEELLPLGDKVLGPDAPALMDWRAALQQIYSDSGRHADAVRLGREVLAARTRVMGPEHPDTITSMTNLALSLQQMGQDGEALQLARKARDTAVKRFGPDNVETLTARHQLGRMLKYAGQYAEAEQETRAVLEARTRVQGPAAPETLYAMTNLAVVIGAQGRWPEAETIGLSAIDLAHRTPDARPIAPELVYNLGCAAARAGNAAAAVKYVRQAFDEGFSLEMVPLVAADGDLAPVKDDPAFKALIAELQRRARPR